MTKRIESAIASAYRTIVPAYRTALNNAILREAGIPAARVLLEAAWRRQAARIQTLDRYYPVVARMGRETRLGRLVGCYDRSFFSTQVLQSPITYDVCQG